MSTEVSEANDSGEIKRAKPLHNYLYLTVGNIATKLLALISLVYMTHTLGKGLFGDYTLIISFVGLFGVLTDLGLNTLAIRDLAPAPEQTPRYTANLLALRLTATTCVFVAIVALAQFYTAPTLHVAIYAYTLALFPISVSVTLGVVYESREQMIYAGLTSIATSTIATIATIIVLASGYHVLAITIVFALANTLGALINLRLVFGRLIRWTPAIDVTLWPTLLRRAFPFFVLSLLLALYSGADVQILYIVSGCAHSHGCASTGQYGLALRPLNVLAGVFYGGLNAATLPLLARVAGQSLHEIARLVRSSTRLALAIGVPIALFMSVYSSDVLSILGGRDFQPAVPALAIVIWTFPCGLIESIWFNTLYALHRQDVVVRAFGITAIFNIVSNVLLIPHFGFVASSALTVASEVLNMGLVYVVLRQRLGVLGFERDLLKLSAIMLPAAGVLILLHALGPFVDLIAGVPIGSLVIVVGYIHLRLLGTTERVIMSSIPVIGRYAPVICRGTD